MPAAFLLQALTRQPDFGRERRAMADTLALGFGAGGVLGLIAVLLPIPDQLDIRGTVAVAVASVAVAGASFLLRDRLPLWANHLLLLAATALITLSIAFNGDPTNNNELSYLFVAAFGFYFFAVIGGVAHTLIALVAYGWVMADISGGRVEPTALLMLAGVMVTVGSITRLLGARARQLVSELSSLAVTDHLTGLLNRRGIQRQVESERERAARSGEAFSLLVADLDRFKQVNDRLGHMGGDMALERVASLLGRAKRRPDSAARVGGEEFAVLLPQIDEHGALIAAERLREMIEEDFKSRPAPLTMSIGIASYPGHGRSWEELLHAADQALYAAKALGRNRSVIYSAEAERLSAAPAATALADEL